MNDRSQHPESPSSAPEPWIQRIVFVLIASHLVVTAASWWAADTCPMLVAGLADRAAAYTQATHFGIDGSRTYYARGGIDERAVEFEVSTAEEPTESDWRSLSSAGWSGLASQDRRQRYLRSAITLAEADQFGLAAKWLMPLIQNTREDVTHVRLVWIPSLFSTVKDDQAAPPYVARLIRRTDGVEVVHLPADRLTAIAVKVSQ